jgi:hypothetical protein
MASDVGKAFRTKLLTYGSVSAIVGQRMYPDQLLQTSTLPAIVYTKISTERDHEITNVTRSGHVRIQMDCYAASREGANDLAHAIRNTGICAFKGTLSGIYLGCTTIDSGDSYGTDTPTDGNQAYRYITSFDFKVHYWEAA